MEDISLICSSVAFLDDNLDWDNALKRITDCTRIAYRSHNRFDRDLKPAEARKSDEALIKRLLFREEGDKSPRHTSTLEHAQFGVVLITSRAIANEFVRHRHTAYTQESTRYVNFDKKGAEFIIPWKHLNDDKFCEIYSASCRNAWNHYQSLLDAGYIPQDARDVLPLGLATRMAMTTNIAEWRHIFNLRCDKGAHHEAQAIANTILNTFWGYAPWAFDDLYKKFDIANAPKVRVVPKDCI